MQLNLIIVVPVYFSLAICRKSIFILILRANQSLHVNLCHSQLVYRWRCQLLVRALTTMESNNHEAVSTVCVGMRAYKNIYVYSHAWRKYFWIRHQELLLDFQYGGLHVLFLSMGTVHVHVCGRVCACVQPPCLIFFSQATLPTYTPKSPSLSFKASHSPEKCHHKGKGRDKARGMVVWVWSPTNTPVTSVGFRYLFCYTLSFVHDHPHACT